MGRAGLVFPCKGERLSGEGSGGVTVKEANMSHEGHSGNNLQLLRGRAPRKN